MNILRVSVIEDENGNSTFAYCNTQIPIPNHIVSKVDFMYLIWEKLFPCKEVTCALEDIVFGMEKEIFARILINKSAGNVTGEVTFNQLLEYLVPEYDMANDLIREGPNQ